MSRDSVSDEQGRAGGPGQPPETTAPAPGPAPGPTSSPRVDPPPGPPSDPQSPTGRGIPEDATPDEVAGGDATRGPQQHDPRE